MTAQREANRIGRKVQIEINRYNSLALDPSPFTASTFLKMRDEWISTAQDAGYKVTGSTLKGWRVRPPRLY